MSLLFIRYLHASCIYGYLVSRFVIYHYISYWCIQFFFTDNIPPSQENTVYLISALPPSYLFLHETHVGTHPTLFFSNKTKRFKIPILSKLKSKVFHHIQFGGCTSTKIFLGSINLPSYSPHLTTLRRTIGNYLSHGIFCSSIPATSYLDESSLTDHHLMPLSLALHTIQMKHHDHLQDLALDMFSYLSCLT